MKSRINVLTFTPGVLADHLFSKNHSRSKKTSALHSNISLNRIRHTLQSLSLYILLITGLSACSDAYNSGTIQGLRNGTLHVSTFEAKNGKIGAFAVTPLIAQASQTLGMSFSAAESSIKGYAEFTEFRNGGNNTTQISPGPHVFAAANASGTSVSSFESVTYKNTGNSPAVLMLEAHEHDGTAQGFSYIQLDPGDTFVYKHNHHPAVVVVAVIGGVAVTITVVVVVVDLVDIAITDIANALVPGVRCVFVKNNILPNYCSGQRCPAPTTCTAATTKPYNWSGTEPATCGCI